MNKISISQWELMEALRLNNESYANRRTAWSNAHLKTRQALLDHGFVITATLTLSNRGYKYLRRMESMLYTALNTPITDTYLAAYMEATD